MEQFELKSISELEQIAKGPDHDIREIALREIAKRENGRRRKPLLRLQPHHYGISTLP